MPPADALGPQDALPDNEVSTSITRSLRDGHTDNVQPRNFRPSVKPRSRHRDSCSFGQAAPGSVCARRRFASSSCAERRGLSLNRAGARAVIHAMNFASEARPESDSLSVPAPWSMYAAAPEGRRRALRRGVAMRGARDAEWPACPMLTQPRGMLVVLFLRQLDDRPPIFQPSQFLRSSLRADCRAPTAWAGDSPRQRLEAPGLAQLRAAYFRFQQ